MLIILSVSLIKSKGTTSVSKILSNIYIEYHKIKCFYKKSVLPGIAPGTKILLK